MEHKSYHENAAEIKILWANTMKNFMPTIWQHRCMDILLEKYKLPKFTRSPPPNLIRSVSSEEIKFVIKISPKIKFKVHMVLVVDLIKHLRKK